MTLGLPLAIKDILDYLEPVVHTHMHMYTHVFAHTLPYTHTYLKYLV